MRIRYNIRASIQTVLEVEIPESWNFHLSEVTDALVVFSGDQSKVTYRLVCFYVTTNVSHPSAMDLPSGWMGEWGIGRGGIRWAG